MIARRLARAFGYDLIPRRKLKDLDAQLVATLDAAGGRRGDRRRRQSRPVRRTPARGRLARPVLSIEPTPSRARPAARAAADPAWRRHRPWRSGQRAARPCSRSAESDMSSSCASPLLLQAISPSLGRAAADRRAAAAARRARRAAAAALAAAVRQDRRPGRRARRPRRHGRLWERVQGLQLEMALVPLYEGERPWLDVIAGLASRGFAPYLLFPGYFARALGRQVQLDAVFYRAGDRAAATARVMRAGRSSLDLERWQRQEPELGSLPHPPRGLAVRRRLPGRGGPAGLCGRRCSGWACSPPPGAPTSSATRCG